MSDELKRAWELHIKSHFADRDVVSVSEVNDWWAERGAPTPLAKASTPQYHGAYDPMCRAGFRKLTRGDFVRANRATLDQRPQCEPRQPSNVEAHPIPETSPADNDRAMVQVLRNATTLRSDFPDGEPRIADDDLGRFLGYSKPESVRTVIKRHYASLGIVFSVKIIPDGPGRPGVRHFLTERQALQVLRWSDTPTADACYAHIVDVFLAWRAGRRLATTSAPPAPMAPTGPDYLSAISEMHRTMSEGLERTVSTITATLVPLTSILDRLATKLLEPAAAPALTPVTAPVAPPSASVWPGYVRLDPTDRVPSNHFSAQGYGSARGVTGRKRLKDLGRRAKEITVERGLDAFEKVTGDFPVRFWHVDALRAAYNEMIGARQ